MKTKTKTKTIILLVVLALISSVAISFCDNSNEFSKDCENRFGESINIDGYQFCVRPDIR